VQRIPSQRFVLANQSQWATSVEFQLISLSYASYETSRSIPDE